MTQCNELIIFLAASEAMPRSTFQNNIVRHATSEVDSVHFGKVNDEKPHNSHSRCSGENARGGNLMNNSNAYRGAMVTFTAGYIKL